MPVEIPSMSIMLHRSWWVLLLRGAAAIIFGVLTWMQPQHPPPRWCWCLAPMCLSMAC
jgi:hypothetical protein